MKKEMPDPLTRQQFRDAVDHRLSGLTEDPWLAQKIIANELEAPKMKKRLSLGLVTALIMIFAVTIGLAENWDTVSDVFSNGVGTHPDLVSNQPERKDLEPKEEQVLDRYIIEDIYAPVTVAVVNEEGTEVSSISINTPVARLQYIYKLILTNQLDEEGGYGFQLYPDRLVTAPEENAFGMPFAPYLFIEGNLVSANACQYSGKSYTDYRLDFTPGQYSVRYNAKIYLSEQGQFIGGEEAMITGSFGLVDENGEIPADSRFHDLSDTVMLSVNGEDVLSIQYVVPPTPMPESNRETNESATQIPLVSPTPMPETVTQVSESATQIPPVSPSPQPETVTQVSESTTLIIPASPAPIPAASAIDGPGRVVLPEHESGIFSSEEWFGASYSDCYTDENGNPVEIRCWQDMYALFNHSAFENSIYWGSEFWGREGMIPWDESAYWLTLGGGIAGYAAQFIMLAPPQMAVKYQEDRYIVSFTGGVFQVTYPNLVYHSADQVRYITRVDYATETLPYDFTFELPLPERT